MSLNGKRGRQLFQPRWPTAPRTHTSPGRGISSPQDTIAIDYKLLAQEVSHSLKPSPAHFICTILAATAPNRYHYQTLGKYSRAATKSQ
uniref:Uncharacterized protein n=1 Tax=Pyxicephalus adspersus TaxID=30357 RepID=A0AAV3B4W6_PYXAD|nr:TPA: hypothetical protein GDO54_000045 [Pyxicephalus adspersus]